MNTRRIVPNIPSAKMEQSRAFYHELLGLALVMDMEWILTFASPSNPTAQISIVKQDSLVSAEPGITVSMEVDDIDELYRRVMAGGHKILYPITDEAWGVRRFFVQDPNGVTINIMSHIRQ